RQRVAMTGELSLIGRVLPVGGIKEKLLAAKRAGINTVILSKLNQKDLAEIPDYALKGMKIHWVSHVEEVFDLALVNRATRSVSPSASDRDRPRENAAIAQAAAKKSKASRRRRPVGNA